MGVESTALSTGGVEITALQAREDIMIGAAGVPTDATKIDKTAKEFEAVLLGNWLQQAEQSFATVPGADNDQDVGRGQMMSMGVQSLATSMANSGALGIGAMIAKAMHRMTDKGDASGSTAKRTEGLIKTGNVRTID